MQRILHIVGKMDRAGAETMIMNLYRTIDRKEFQFDFVVFTDEPGDYDSEIKSLSGNIYVLDEQNPINRMFALKKLLNNHPEYKILHSHTLFGSAFHIFAGKMAKVPYRIAHSHSTNRSSPNRVVSSLYKKFSKRIINGYSTNFISCSKDAGEFLFPNQKDILILPNSIDTAHFSEIGETHKNFLSKEFNIDDSYLKIIQVGRFQEVKNHKFSIDIAKSLKERNIPFKMFFVGNGGLYDEVKEQIRVANLQDEILLLGLRSDIPKLMAGADLMLMPSLHEGFPVVLVESQSVGLPSLISDNISKEVDLGIELIDFESLDASLKLWIDKMRYIKKQKPIPKELRLNKLAEQGFDINSSARILSNLYRSMK